MEEFITDNNVIDQVLEKCEDESKAILMYSLGRELRDSKQYSDVVAKQFSEIMCTVWLLQLVQNQHYGHLITSSERFMLDKVVVHDMVESICKGVKKVRCAHIELIPNRLKKDKLQITDSTIRLQKYIKKFTAHPEDESQDDQARDIIARKVRLVSKKFYRLKTVPEIQEDSKKKLELVIKAFVIENIVLFCEGLSEQKQVTVTNFIEALHLPAGINPEEEITELVSCMEDVAGMLPGEVLVSASTPATVRRLIKEEDWVKRKDVQKVVKKVQSWADIVECETAEGECDRKTDLQQTTQLGGSRQKEGEIGSQEEVHCELEQVGNKNESRVGSCNDNVKQTKEHVVIRIGREESQDIRNGIDNMKRRHQSAAVRASVIVFGHIPIASRPGTVYYDLMDISLTRGLEIDKVELTKLINVEKALKVGKHDDYYSIVLPLKTEYKFLAGMCDAFDVKHLLMLAPGVSRPVPSAVQETMHQMTSFLYTVQPGDAQLLKE